MLILPYGLFIQSKTSFMKRFKYILLIATAFSVLSCSQRVAYTDSLRDEYDLTPLSLKKVQFFTSSQIILQRSSQSGSQGISTDGKLVMNQRSKEDRIIINPSTKCVFEKDGETGAIFIRFEVGTGKILKFAVRKNQSNGRYYLDANWQSGKGGELNYGNQIYYANSASGNAFLMVSIKKLKRTQRKDRVIKGIKV